MSTDSVDRETPPDYFEGRRREVGWVFKKYRNMPRYYRGPLAAILGRYHILLLTTTGRKTGLPRRTMLTFMPVEGGLAVAAGLGERCDWYQNLVATPGVEVRVGRQRFRAEAEAVTDPARRRELVVEFVPYWDGYGPPRALRRLMRRLFHFDYDEEIVQGVTHAEHMPVVILRPSRGEGRDTSR